MLSPEETLAIEAEMPRYPDRRAVCIDALQIVQQRRGWVSDEALADVAEFLQLPLAELEGVATFYNMIFRESMKSIVLGISESALFFAGS